MYLRLGCMAERVMAISRSIRSGCKNNEKESETKLSVAKVYIFFIFFVFCPTNKQFANILIAKICRY
jgi:hypothetical protein